MMWDGMPGMGWVWMWIWTVVGVAMLVLVVLAVVWLARSAGGSEAGSSSGSAPHGGPSAREVLDLRYAKGEITRDEYVQARRDLDGAP
jgi:putative membrane protein